MSTDLSKDSDALIGITHAAVTLADRYTAPGWIEYLLWETLEGTRDRPFKFLDELTAEETKVLRRLRDEAKIWIVWDNNQWCQVEIDAWRKHAEKNKAEDIFQSLLTGVRQIP